MANGSDAFKRWVDFDPPMFYRVYFFQVENAQNLSDGGFYPILREVGPYVLRERKTKQNIEINATTTDISFDPINYFEFDQELSGNLTLNDTLTVINLPLMAVCKQSEKYKSRPIYYNAFIAAVKKYNQSPFITLTAEELIYGYKVDAVEELAIIAKALHLPLPNPLVNNTFGIVYEV